jgi:hypothetical protein
MRKTLIVENEAEYAILPSAQPVNAGGSARALPLD